MPGGNGKKKKKKTADLGETQGVRCKQKQQNACKQTGMYQTDVNRSRSAMYVCVCVCVCVCVI